MIMVKRAGK